LKTVKKFEHLDEDTNTFKKLVNCIEMTSSCHRKLPTLEVSLNSAKKLLTALVDTGADSNFISEKIVKELQLPTVPKTSRTHVRLANSAVTQPIERCTIPLKLSHHFDECVVFDVFPELNFDIILGTTWMRKAKPTICWDAILLAHSRAMLQSCHQQVGKEYWDYAVEYAAYLKNRLPHSSLPNNCSPVEMLGQAAPNHATTHTFGCLCYTKLHNKTNKLENRGVQTHFLGIPKTSSGMYTLADDGKVFRSTNVTIARQSHFPVPATVLERAHLIQNLQKDGQGGS
jgi:hypothetical protein